MSYSPPGVTVNVQNNPRIINIAGDVRIPAIVGMGPMTVSVTDEAVVRGSGALDYLAAYPATNVTISQLAKRPGLVTGSIDYITGINGSLYQQGSSSYLPQGSGIILWTQDPNQVTSGTAPATGSVYYANYTFSVTADQFLPRIYSDKNQLIADRGAESNSTGLLTIAGSLALENGAPAVMVSQASGSSFTQLAYRNAIDNLKKKTNIEQIVCVFPSGSSVTETDRQAIQTYAFNHAQIMNQVGRERGVFWGVSSPYYSPTGWDTVGDSSIANSYVGLAGLLRNEDIVLTAPNRVRRVDPNNNVIELDSAFAACAVAGMQAAQTLRSTPITGKTIVGLVMEDDKWNDYEMNAMGGAGVLVLQTVGGITTIRDAVTTDITSADTSEISIIATKRLLKWALRTGLFNTYTNKGKTINAQTPRDVEATTRSILNTLRNQGEIFGYGTKDDPTTGETKITAIQDTTEPRKINVTASIKYLYPLKYIAVTISTYV